MSTDSIAELQARLESLESKVAFQEVTIDQLNDEITNMNLQFAVVTRQVKLLAEKLKENKGSVVASMSEETPPPHY
ncbi:SlyX family protein [Psychrosphaera ytuae]|uniref:Protein SlyX homolog n=1 Tax=Psychrosphaera ytuae TaxID=2820710 RepID=A0A975D9S2_9GAMM|nr:SlyX family protein [Psychrosphaera ytuae]QTH63142.1 SlyX family protein [Psychrosphaera ytuae]